MEDLSSQRGNWGSRFGIMMAMAGMAIGLGNVWRFPYLVGQWGGGAFVVAYLVLLFIVVIPLSIVEIGMGKGTQKGNIDTFGLAFGNRKAGTPSSQLSRRCLPFSMLNFSVSGLSLDQIGDLRYVRLSEGSRSVGSMV